MYVYINYHHRFNKKSTRSTHVIPNGRLLTDNLRFLNYANWKVLLAIFKGFDKEDDNSQVATTRILFKTANVINFYKIWNQLFQSIN